MKLTLRKALQKKNKLVGEATRIRQLIAKSNQTLYIIRETDGVEDKVVSTAPKYDIKELMKQLQATVDGLVSLKTTIAKANVAIYEKIYRMSELKNEINQIRSLNTRDGRNEDYNGKVTVTEVVYDELWVDEKVKQLEEEIEKLQDEIDEFNAKTTIEVAL